MAEQRSGYVALVGRPNAGKSTLLNAMVGDKVAIVSPTPQTTRNRIVGIVSDARGQAVFLDLPGVHKPLHRLNTKMMQEVRSAIEEVDVVLHLVDASVPWGKGEEFLFGMLTDVSVPVIGVLTKVDLVRPRQRLLPLIEAYVGRRPDTPVVPISAVEGDGLSELRTELYELLPAGPAFYPAGLTTTQTERFFVAELIREQLLRHTTRELPYTTGVVVESFDEGDELLRLEAVVYVERSGQKAIVIGKGGRTVKTVGQAARLELERVLGVRVYLGLRVKAHPRWREDPRILAQMEPGIAQIGDGELVLSDGVGKEPA